MNSNILNIDTLAAHDNAITDIQFIPFAPYSTNFNLNDEIRIAVQSKDSYLLPCESYLYMKILATTTGTHANDDAEVRFVENFASYLFNEVKYELNGVLIDSLKNVGRASTMKLQTASRESKLFGYFKYCKAMKQASARSTVPIATGNAVQAPRTLEFEVVLPLRVLINFADDYCKIIANAKHELILNLARSTLDCCRGGGAAGTAATVGLQITQILWKMPQVTLSDQMKLNMLNYLSRNKKIHVQYRSMDLFEYPALPTTTSTVWAVKTVSHVSRPRFVIFGAQTNKKDVRVADASNFDNCNINDVRLFLNNKQYPYNRQELNISNGLCAELYHEYTKMQSSYYNNTEHRNPFTLTFTEFQESPLFVFDCSKSDESLINSAVDIKLEIKASAAIPANTAGYCLLIYENSFSYSPFDGIVIKTV